MFKRLVSCGRRGFGSADNLSFDCASRKRLSRGAFLFGRKRRRDWGENVVAMPHLGASTPESEDNCAVMAADQVKDYLENGNIKNSVNFPAVSMARSADTRICVLHRNKPNVIATVTGAIAATGANVENMESKSRGDYGYMIIDVTGPAADAAKATENLEDVIKVRVID